MKFSLTFPIHSIPLWFLILSLFLPRLSIFVAWLQHSMSQFIPPSVGVIPIIVWLLLPSRAAANVCIPPPAPTRTQKLTELSGNAELKVFVSTPACPEAFVNRTP